MKAFRSRPGLIIPDVHWPFHDEVAWKLAMRVGRFVGCKWVKVLGDAFDFYAVSRHDKSVERKERLVDELHGMSRLFRDVEALGAEEHHYVMGNHENRLNRYIERAARPLHGLKGLTIHEILDLEKRGWTWSPYGKRHQFGKQVLKHDFGRAGDKALKHALMVADSDVWIGHTHLAGEWWGVSRRTGESIRSMSFGWLGSFDSIDYCDQDDAAYRWSHGCGVGWTQPDGSVRAEVVRFVNGRATVGGQRV